MQLTLKPTWKKLDAVEDDLKKLQQGCQSVMDLKDEIAENVKGEIHESQEKAKKQCN